MKAYVFTDEALERHAGRFVWLSVDTEREENAAFVARFPVEAWPTLMVVDPHTEEVALRWLGSATVRQLDQLLEDGERTVRGAGSDLERRLAEADRAYGQGDQSRASKLLGALRVEAPVDWPSRPRVVETLLYSLDDQAECFKVALEELPRLPRTASWANVAAVGLGCGVALLEEQAPKEIADGVATLEKAVRDALASEITMAADDRSGLYDALYAARAAAGDEEGARQIATRWAQFLEGEADKATTPEQRTVFDSHRLVAYLRLGAPERAIPMLTRSERDLPEDYNPPARLTIVFRELGRYQDALAANDRALQKAYGPRKVRVFLERAATFRKMKEKAKAAAALDEAQRHLSSLPKAQQSPGIAYALERARAEVEAMP